MVCLLRSQYLLGPRGGRRAIKVRQYGALEEAGLSKSCRLIVHRIIQTMRLDTSVKKIAKDSKERHDGSRRRDGMEIVTVQSLMQLNGVRVVLTNCSATFPFPQIQLT
jgi:hypothetical protein